MADLRRTWLIPPDITTKKTPKSERKICNKEHGMLYPVIYVIYEMNSKDTETYQSVPRSVLIRSGKRHQSAFAKNTQGFLGPPKERRSGRGRSVI